MTGQECKFFKPAYTHDSIVQEMLSDIRDPSICGAKEPKIAALMWVLHENPEAEETKDEDQSEDVQRTGGIMSWLGTLFK